MDGPATGTLQSPLLQHFCRDDDYFRKRCACAIYMSNVNWSPGTIIKPKYFEPIDKDKVNFNTQAALLVDLVGFIFFSIFVMFEFWFRIAYYSARCFLILKTADGIVQLTAAASLLFVLCSVIIQTILFGGLKEVGGQCY